MKIAIFGGAFNPVHLEHVALVKQAKRHLHLDKIIVIPTGISPHKRGKMVADGNDRLAMCRLAFGGISGVEVSDIEIVSPTVSYSYITCQKIKEQYPNDELYFLIGADMLAYFPKWKEPQKILECVTLCACGREGEAQMTQIMQKFERQFGKRCIAIPYTGECVSSTEVRVQYAFGEHSQYVPKKVDAYIQKHKLYQLPPLLEVKNFLKPERYEHTLRVATMAAQNCSRIGWAEEDALLSAGLHDIAKYLPQTDERLSTFVAPDNVPAPVMHQYTGAHIAEHTFGICDEAILNAIRYHTSGRRGMSEQELLIYLCDMLEAGRAFPQVEELRKAFAISLRYGMKKALQHQLKYFEEQNASVYPLTIEAYEWIKENQMNCKEKVNLICSILSAKKSGKITIINVSEKTSLCDYFVVTNGRSTTQTKSLAENLEEKMKKEYDMMPDRMEGLREGNWAVLDFGDVIVHIFNEEERLFYNLERLWDTGSNTTEYQED